MWWHDKVKVGQLWYDYGWCVWRLVTRIDSYGNAWCIGIRQNGSVYSTFVGCNTLIRGKLVFNRCRLKSERLRRWL
jgi:hypothetical protein